MAIDNVFDPAIECIEPIRDDEPLLMGLHIIVSISRRGTSGLRLGYRNGMSMMLSRMLLGSP